MKVYFYMATILYLGMIFRDGRELAVIPKPVLWEYAKVAGDVLILGACVLACYGLAFKKKYLDVAKWRMMYPLTILLGLFTGALLAMPEKFGILYREPSGLLDIAMRFLPYILFAVPVILYQHELTRKK